MQNSTMIATGLGWFKGLFAGHADHQAARSRARPRKMGVEGLEKRDCPATLQDFAATLISVTHADATRSVAHVATIETLQPTLMGPTLAQDALKVNADIQHGTLVQLFSDYGTMIKHVNLEVVLASALHKPAAASLANYTAIQSDIRAVSNDYAATVILLRDLTAKVQTTAVPAAAPVSGLTQSYADLATMSRWGGMTPQQNPALQGLVQAIPASAWSKDPSVIAVNQMVDHMLGG